MPNPPAITSNDLQTYVASYGDGLISGHELVCIAKACVRNEPFPSFRYGISPAPGLEAAFTPKGIKALLTRLDGSRELAEEMLLGTWTVSPDGRTLSTHIVMHGDQAPEHAPGDHEWIMPRIEFPMPDGSIHHDILPEQFRHLTITGELLHFAGVPDPA